MSAFTDEDGVDGPFEKAMARAERADKRRVTITDREFLASPGHYDFLRATLSDGSRYDFQWDSDVSFCRIYAMDGSEIREDFVPLKAHEIDGLKNELWMRLSEQKSEASE